MSRKSISERPLVTAEVFTLKLCLCLNNKFIEIHPRQLVILKSIS